ERLADAADGYLADGREAEQGEEDGPDQGVVRLADLLGEEGRDHRAEDPGYGEAAEPGDGRRDEGLADLGRYGQSLQLPARRPVADGFGHGEDGDGGQEQEDEVDEVGEPERQRRVLGGRAGEEPAGAASAAGGGD